jgi:hypothetical protein
MVYGFVVVMARCSCQLWTVVRALYPYGVLRVTRGRGVWQWQWQSQSVAVAAGNVGSSFPPSSVLRISVPVCHWFVSSCNVILSPSVSWQVSTPRVTISLGAHSTLGLTLRVPFSHTNHVVPQRLQQACLPHTPEWETLGLFICLPYLSL